jgi:hypothetical protein
MPTEIDFVATITVDDRSDNPISVDLPLIQTAPDKHIVFIVRNVGKNSHKVSIPREKVQKKEHPQGVEGPDTPITFFGKHSDHVDAGDVGAIILRIRDKDDFGGEPREERRYFKYKYTIKASGLDDLDPDIGINN